MWLSFLVHWPGEGERRAGATVGASKVRRSLFTPFNRTDDVRFQPPQPREENHTEPHTWPDDHLTTFISA